MSKICDGDVNRQNFTEEASIKMYLSFGRMSMACFHLDNFMVPANILKSLPVKGIISNTGPQVTVTFQRSSTGFSTKILQNEAFFLKKTIFVIPGTDQFFILFQYSIFLSIFRGAITPGKFQSFTVRSPETPTHEHVLLEILFFLGFSVGVSCGYTDHH